MTDRAFLFNQANKKFKDKLNKPKCFATVFQLYFDGRFYLLVKKNTPG